MKESKQARVIGSSGHRFEIGQIVTLVREVTHFYYSIENIENDEIEERYYEFVDETGFSQDLQDDKDFEWLKG